MSWGIGSTRTLLLIAAATLACGGGGGGPTGVPTGDIRGHYTITHNGSIVGTGALSCPGLLDITTQDGTSFSGTITITETPECQGVASQGTISGTVSSGGAVTFTVSIPFLDALLEAAGCTILSGGTTFTGTVTTVVFSATRTNRLRCEVEPGQFLEVDLVYTISGPKT
jgi:hypothetical protein